MEHILQTHTTLPTPPNHCLHFPQDRGTSVLWGNDNLLQAQAFPKKIEGKKIILKIVKPHSLYKYADFEPRSPLQQTCVPSPDASAQLWRCCSPGSVRFLLSGENYRILVKVISEEGTIKKSPLPQT